MFNVHLFLVDCLSLGNFRFCTLQVLLYFSDYFLGWQPCQSFYGSDITLMRIGLPEWLDHWCNWALKFDSNLVKSTQVSTLLCYKVWKVKELVRISLLTQAELDCSLSEYWHMRSWDLGKTCVKCYSDIKICLNGSCLALSALVIFWSTQRNQTKVWHFSLLKICYNYVD